MAPNPESYPEGVSQFLRHTVKEEVESLFIESPSAIRAFKKMETRVIDVGTMRSRPLTAVERFDAVIKAPAAGNHVWKHIRSIALFSPSELL